MTITSALALYGASFVLTGVAVKTVVAVLCHRWDPSVYVSRDKVWHVLNLVAVAVVWGCGQMEWVHRVPAVPFPYVAFVILVLPDVLHGWPLKGDEALSFKEFLSIALANALALASLAYAPWIA